MVIKRENVLNLERDGKTITLLQEEEAKVPSFATSYSVGEEVIIGEPFLSRVPLNESVGTIRLFLALASHRRENIKREIIPLSSSNIIDIAEKQVLVEHKTRAGSFHLPTLMSFKAAKKFHEGAEPIDWRSAYEWVNREITRYVNLDWDPRLYDVTSCWVLDTYFPECFSAFPFLYFYGPSGSGKTRILTTTTLLCRHGFIATDPSPASLFRISEAIKPTMGIDESLAGPNTWKIVRTSFKKGGRVLRAERTARGDFLVRSFETYMPIAFASTRMPQELGGLEADEARAIFVTMRQEKDPIGHDPDEYEFAAIRDELYLLRLLRVRDVLDSLKIVTGEFGNFRGHEREVWMPLLAIAKLIGEDVLGNVSSYADEVASSKREDQYREEKMIISAIISLFQKRGGQVLEFSSIDLLKFIEDGVAHQFWSQYKVGRVLARMDISRRRLSGGTQYRITLDSLKDLIKRYEYELSSDISDISDTSIEN
jgi:hypothetical protein